MMRGGSPRFAASYGTMPRSIRRARCPRRGLGASIAASRRTSTTAAECDALLRATKRLYRPRAAPEGDATLFALLLATGLRISEALALEVRDAISTRAVTVRNGKLGKSRLLPLHADRWPRGSTGDGPRSRVCVPVLLLYAAPRINVRGGADDVRVSAPTTLDRRVSKAVHDLRHTFAVGIRRNAKARTSTRTPTWRRISGTSSYRHVLVPVRRARTLQSRAPRTGEAAT